MNLKQLAFEVENASLDRKRIICAELTFNDNPEALVKWNRNPSSVEGDWVMKPQYFHSAVGIYLMIKYPQLRFTESIANQMAKLGLTSRFLSLTEAVIANDPDGLEFLKVDFNKVRCQIVFRDVTFNLA